MRHNKSCSEKDFIPSRYLCIFLAILRQSRHLWYCSESSLLHCYWKKDEKHGFVEDAAEKGENDETGPFSVGAACTNLVCSFNLPRSSVSSGTYILKDRNLGLFW